MTMSRQLFVGTRIIITAGGSLKLWQGTSELGYCLNEDFLGGRRCTAPFFASGAAMAIAKSLFERLGGFDVHLPLYCEDLDLSWRARLMGYSVRCTTESVVFHHISGTSGAFTPSKLRLVAGHHIAVMLKCLSVPNLLHALPAYIAFTMLAGAGLAILEHRVAYFASVLLAYRDTVENLRDIGRRRRETQAQRVMGDKQVLMSEGFGLFDAPWTLLRSLRRGRQLSKSRLAAGSGYLPPGMSLKP
jgi:GT2 family glycosyltransferase